MNMLDRLIKPYTCQPIDNIFTNKLKCAYVHTNTRKYKIYIYTDNHRLGLDYIQPKVFIPYSPLLKISLRET